MSLIKVVNEGLLNSQANLVKQNQYESGKARRSEDAAHEMLMNSIDLEKKIKKLEEENLFYKNLLTKPFKEIADIDNNFKETYYEQQTKLGEWMVSQRAFKELAIKLGLDAGMTKDDVMTAHSKNKEKVINNQTEHGNNFIENDKDEWAKFYAPRIKARLNIK